MYRYLHHQVCIRAHAHAPRAHARVHLLLFVQLSRDSYLLLSKAAELFVLEVTTKAYLHAKRDEQQLHKGTEGNNNTASHTSSTNNKPQLQLEVCMSNKKKQGICIC
jgi:hypothetical protein